MKLTEGVAFQLDPKTMSRILNIYDVYVCVDICIYIIIL